MGQEHWCCDINSPFQQWELDCYSKEQEWVPIYYFERKLNKFIESTIVQLRGTVSDRDTSQHRAQKIIHKTRKPKNVRPTLPKESPHDSFVRLKNYIIHARTEQANYQPVMIRALLKNNGYCSKDIIANELYLYNTSKKKDPTFYKYVPVFGVLEKNGVVVKDVDGYFINWS